MSSVSTQLPVAEGRGSVSGVPSLPDRFTDTFSSRFVDVGELRLHAVIGGGTLAADPDALRGSFELYRQFPTIIAQNEQRKARRLTLPVLAIGGEESGGAGVAETMKLVADDVQGVVLPGAAHWVAEQAPEELLAALTEFLAPYRDGTE
jgi:pimeloyl-ACP methyl ester carboxylesterase